MREQLREIRKGRGETQLQFAVRNKLSLSGVNGVETGKIQRFPFRRAERYAKAYGLSVARFEEICGIQQPVPAA